MRLSSHSTHAIQDAPRRVAARACMILGAGMMLWSLVPLLWRGQAPTAPTSATQAAIAVQSGAPVEASVDSALPADSGAIAASVRKASHAEQAQIEALYARWKSAWKRKDIETCMSFYAPKAKVRSVNGIVYSYKGARAWFSGYLRGDPYRITNKPLVIYSDGQRATFTSKETYKRGASADSGVVFNDRFVWQKQPAQRSPKQPSWLIVEQAYMPDDMDSE